MPPVPISLIPMRPRHLAEVADLEARVQRQPWTRTLFEQELDRPDRWYVTAWTPGTPQRLVGYGGVMLMLEDAHITTIATAPAYRGSGIATTVMAALLTRAVAMGANAATLEVRSGNVSAQRLYRRFGFEAVGTRPGYYPGSKDAAVIMWAHWSDQASYLGVMPAREVSTDCGAVHELAGDGLLCPVRVA